MLTERVGCTLNSDKMATKDIKVIITTIYMYVKEKSLRYSFNGVCVCVCVPVCVCVCVCRCVGVR